MRRILKYTLVIVIGIPVLIALLGAGALIYFDDSSGSVETSGERRDFLLHVPDSVTGDAPVPLVISLHVAYLMPSSQKRHSEWNDIADRHGFIVAYPAGKGFPKLWRGIAPGDGRETEVRFFEDLIDHLQDQYPIDPNRIYVNGYSNGAAMTEILSCELEDRIAAIGVVALPVPEEDWCVSSKKMPVIAFQGKLDAYAPYDGGEHPLASGPMQSIPDRAATWGARNRCNKEPVVTSVASDVVLTRYVDCPDGADVSLYTIVDGGHTWPGVPRMPEWGVGKTTESIHATELMWAFFSDTHVAALD